MEGRVRVRVRGGVRGRGRVRGGGRGRVGVADLVEPDGGEDEEELDEDGAEGQHAAHQDGKDVLHVPRLVRVRGSAACMYHAWLGVRGSAACTSPAHMHTHTNEGVRCAVCGVQRVRCAVCGVRCAVCGACVCAAPLLRYRGGWPLATTARLLGYGAWDEVGLRRVLDGVPLVPQVGARECEGYRDPEPEHEQREHGAEGDGARRPD